MPTISIFKFPIPAPPPISSSKIFSRSPLILRISTPRPHNFSSISSSKRTLFRSKSSEGDAMLSEAEDEWLQKLPEKKNALYSHSLPCIEAWLKSLGFHQSRDDRAVWFIEKPDWHAQLSLDVTDLYIRYLKSGPGNLEKDVERRFSYALSREDIENAILGGP
ncbi:S-adenosyl-L-methionine-dependentmethyltransferases superfamily protein [Striga asiatica]|uniref:S-adenosyl-L-methionine-dependentmethyltransferases superfamily protein n=1 Tax=Striga asiatica TaxID=4170 RepID=A0A5A7QNK0_STRAF|nr:S-adenosyl-L-methionine-dependentmethyltransferases superfamily protein [Striga asiatica]